MQKENLTPGLQELEGALSALTPTNSRCNRDELFFQAGRASSQKRPIFWPTLSVLLAVLLSVSWLYRPAPITTERVQYVQVIKEAPASLEKTFSHTYYHSSDNVSDAKSYITLRDDILHHGLDALNAKTPTPYTTKSIPQHPTEPLTRWNWQQLLNGESS